VRLSSALSSSDARGIGTARFSSGLFGAMSNQHNNEPRNAESAVRPGCPFRAHGRPNGRKPRTEQAENPKQIKVAPFPVLTSSDVACKDPPSLIFFSLFSSGFVLELFHVFPTAVLIVDVLVTKW